MKLSLPLVLSIFAIARAALGAPRNSPLLETRQNGDAANGWSNIPTPETAIKHTDWKISGYNLTLLISNDTASQIERAVIVVPGGNRNCWTYYTLIHNALVLSSQKNLTSVNKVSVVAPCFMATRDKEAGAVDESNLVWGAVSWDNGDDSVGPGDASVSSYQVIDELIGYYMDPLRFPRLNTLILAGHSMGGQMTQRYAALHKSGLLENVFRKIHIWVGNPGSMVWLVSDRPHPEREASCPGFDKWKYGLNGSFVSYANDASILGRGGIVSRYRSRNVHYLWGTADTGPGSTTCEAMTQGSTHIERGRNFDAMIRDMPGGLPSSHTIDYVPGVGHSSPGMFNSDAGLDKLFVVT